ncbi:hypothetical protein [Breoghania sp. L-A4]|uniref:hypothetical protein n=1 Tax=Breoghania sp. L-A4 TaxID=2304600 RepID=UPI0013C2F6C4|nr:hypothetical protein [Breoghania sp. L-A4]
MGRIGAHGQQFLYPDRESGEARPRSVCYRARRCQFEIVRPPQDAALIRVMCQPGGLSVPARQFIPSGRIGRGWFRATVRAMASNH